MTKTVKKTNRKSDEMDSKVPDWDFKQIMKDIQLFDASHRTWKEKKEFENRKVVSLGGKPPKKQRLPLSVARVQMKNQQEREEKILQENMILGRFGGKHSGGAKRSVDKRKTEYRGLKSSEGYFRNGVLDVKHMLHAGPSRENDSSSQMVVKGKTKMKKKGTGKKHRGGGKKKSGGRKRN
ncbi:uncharacterized protein LOC8277979 [Ricinus communis]|uniref:Uncharacterized protein n=1 Tax=Ricinus communis TaxID=3988 RepID=B9RXG2_RICCO|nr:uncharacterized protein LOC8277979 [Ricinus communis]EEF43818.1 conserved hypothetical protein [Ricinus communis]|eukprot:XP_002518431.1 uncharacterized protein LOC8277979 [Ricinus communis]